jgi:hypothetical protein
MTGSKVPLASAWALRYRTDSPVRFRSKLVAVLLALLTFSGAVGSWHAPDDHDSDRDLLLHDHSAHHERLGTSTAAAAPTHCALCHWLRTFGTSAPRDTQAAGIDAPRLVRRAAATNLVTSSDRLALPPRAPPLT